MITKPTTLILGAGASQPFGFPTGYGLFKSVLAILNRHENPVSEKWFEWMGHGVEKIDEFRNCLLKSGKSSVDAFLEHRQEFIPIGKAAMAISLIARESEKKLFQHEEQSWYHYLFNKLNTKFDEFGKNKLSILTFNYDRSLEHFLFSGLRHAYGKPDVECAAMLREIPIIHLHGTIGNLPHFGKPCRAYDETLNPETLKLATEGIKIVHEGIEDDFTVAKQILSESTYICFLGFGYLPLNLRRLSMHNLALYGHASIWGSTYGLTSAERNEINNGLLHGRMSLPIGPHVGLDVLGFLRESGLLDMVSK